MWVLFVCYLPRAVYRAITHKKYWESWRQRFGYGFPKITKHGNGSTFWVHAPSLGETQAISTIVKRLRQESPGAIIVLSSVTEAGHEAAKRLIPEANFHVFLPFDFYLCVRSVLKKCVPDVVILAETDFWWRFLHEVKKCGAVCLLASGKLSEASYKNFFRFPFFSKKLFSTIDYFCLQSDLYKNRFLSLNISSNKMEVTGNIKGDVHFPVLERNELNDLREKLGFSKEDFLLVVGSSHAPEEQFILRELAPLLHERTNFKLIIVPRHLGRVAEVTKLIADTKLPFHSWTELNPQSGPKVLLVDAMGILIRCYQMADLAIVAGSFTERVGGHNILEPFYFGVPTICGPHMHTQQQLIDTAHAHKAIEQVDIFGLRQVVEELTENTQKRKTLGNNGLNMVKASRGATERTMKVLFELTPQFFPSL
jgi:3-deoxy-D-manno-octulosonic-acid transferase